MESVLEEAENEAVAWVFGGELESAGMRSAIKPLVHVPIQLF